LGFVGFGEAGRALAQGLGTQITARFYDLKLDNPPEAAELLEAAREAGATSAADVGDLLAADPAAVLCLVTADQATSAAESAAPHLRRDPLWLDGNSCAPGTKRRAAAHVEGGGGRYVDVAIMAPVRPLLHRTPMLVAGPHAEAARKLLAGLGMDVTIAGATVGDASAIKMIRSVMIKGMEALTAECLLAARGAGVEDAVIASFEKSDPSIAWRKRSLYNLGRMAEHGLRRAAEMREVALTLRELGLPDRMARATGDWQQQIGRLALDGMEPELGAMLDKTLRALGE
jgi:3-hydroxyisobutyrate dehydrogenase-like beta-hydroxyacid dehydrogenase